MSFAAAICSMISCGICGIFSCADWRASRAACQARPGIFGVRI
jgi:hypothetical protein